MKRPDGMSFEDYRKLLKETNDGIKLYLKGTFFFRSGPSWKRLIGLGLKDEDEDGEPLEFGDLPRGKTYKKPKEEGTNPSPTHSESESTDLSVGELDNS